MLRPLGILRTRLVPAALALPALLALAAPIHADVVVVAPDGSGDATTLTVGVALAAPGDTVLVRAGNYQGVGPFDPDLLITIDKSLTFVGDTTGASIGFMRIQNIGANAAVTVRNINMAQPILAGTSLDTVVVQNCTGPVLFEDCNLVGSPGVSDTIDGAPALVINNCDGVMLSRCNVTGGAGFPGIDLLNLGISAGGDAMTVSTGSRVALYDSTVTGGAGGTDLFFSNGGEHGGDGAVLASSVVFVSGTTITGGAGGDGCPPGSPAPCGGGDGLVQSGVSAILRTVGSAVVEGAGGTLSDASPGPDGTALILNAGQHFDFSEAGRGTVSPITIREGEAGTLSILGPPGEGARIFVSVAPLYAQLGGKKGVYSVADPVIGPIVLGKIDGTGQFDVPFIAPGLLGFEDVVVTVQGYTNGSEGLMFGNATRLVLLQAGF